MTTVSCFECSNKDSILCSICGIAKDGAREHFNQKPITNADRIRAMSDEELAEFFHDMVQDCGCNNVPCQQFCKAARSCELAWLNWLKKEVEGEADEDQT